MAADWLGELAIGGEPGRTSATLQGWLQRHTVPVTQRLQLYRRYQSGGDEYQLGYRAQFNISSSFYHFAQVHSGANGAAGIDAWRSVVIATANSPYRGRIGNLALEAGLGYQRIAATKNAAMYNEGFRAAVFFRAEVSRRVSDRWLARLDLSTLSGRGQNDLRSAVALEFDSGPNTRLALAYRAHRLGLGDNINILDEDILLSINYRFDWIPATRWPAPNFGRY